MSVLLMFVAMATGPVPTFQISSALASFSLRQGLHINSTVSDSVPPACGAAAPSPTQRAPSSPPTPGLTREIESWRRVDPGRPYDIEIQSPRAEPTPASNPDPRRPPRAPLRRIQEWSFPESHRRGKAGQ